MLINPFREDLETVPGTPFLVPKGVLAELIGVQIPMPDGRVWVVQSLLRPSYRRALGGIRSKLYDAKGFITFLNQRDLEVLIGFGKPGEACPWYGLPYLAPGHAGWIGPCADEEDLRDDLFERELFIRREVNPIPEGLTLQRRVHVEYGGDVEETWIFLRETDMQHETVGDRWVRAERARISWKLV